MCNNRYRRRYYGIVGQKLWEEEEEEDMKLDSRITAEGGGSDGYKE